MSYVSETRTVWRAQCDNCGTYYDAEEGGGWWLAKEDVAVWVEHDSGWYIGDNGMACGGCAHFCEGCDEQFPDKALVIYDPDGTRWCATCSPLIAAVSEATS
jgi:hypothetical protein